MKQKGTCLVSAALAVLLTVSTVSGSMVNVFATGTTAEPAEVVQVVGDDAESSEDITLVSKDTDGIQIADKGPQPSVTISEADAGIKIEGEEGYQAGDVVSLRVDAENPGDTDTQLRLYVWDYDQELPEEKDTWSDFLTDACTDVQVSEMNETGKMAVEFIQEDTGMTFDATWVQEKTEDTDDVTARYISLSLPAGASTEFSLSLVSDCADEIVVVPAVYADGNDTYFDALQLQWSDEDIVINGFGQEDEGDGIVVSEQESEDDSNHDIIFEEATDVLDTDSEDMAENGDIVTVEDETEDDDSTTVEDETEDGDTTIVDDEMEDGDTTMAGDDTETVDGIPISTETGSDGIVTDETDVSEDQREDLDDANSEFDTTLTDRYTGAIEKTQHLTVSVIGEGVVSYADVLGETREVTDSFEKDLPVGTYARLVFSESAYVFYYDDGDIPAIISADGNYIHFPDGGFNDVTIPDGINPHVIVVFDEMMALMMMQSSQINAMAFPQNVSVGQEFTGTCYIASVSQNGPGGSVNYVDVNNFSGVLSDVGTVRTTCAHHTAAAPYVGMGVCHYSFTVNAVYDTKVTGRLFVSVPDMTDGVTSNENGLTGYQGVVTTATFDKPPSDTYTKYTVKKVWKDGSNRFSTRPNSVSITLQRKVAGGEYSNYKTATLSASNNWKYTWTNVPYKVDGVQYSYRLVENNVPSNYDAKRDSRWTGSTADGYSATYTNSLQLKVPISVKKVWSDSNDQFGLRPTSIKVQLQRASSTDDYKTWVNVGSAVTLNASNNWYHKWSPQLTNDYVNTIVYHYRIVELDIANYESKITHTGSASDGAAFVTSGYAFTVTNTLTTGKGYLLKVSSNTSITNGNSKYSLKNAVYTVYSDSACKKSVGTLTTDENGKSNTLTLAAGTYYVKETTEPSGYQKDTTVHKLVVTPGKTTELKVSDVPYTGNLKITKVSANTTITDGNNNYTLEGAEFTIYTDSACTKVYKTVKTDKDGIAWCKDMPLGDYWVKETKPSKGYKLNETWVQKVTITKDSTVDVPTETTCEETPHTGNLKIVKKSALPNITDGNNCYSLEGAEFTIYTDSACTKVYATVKTDKDGIAWCKDMPIGDYWVKETKAPMGYEDNPTWSSGKLTITANHTVEKPMETVCEDIPGNDPNSITMTKIWNGDETDTVPSLAGTQFTIKYYDNTDKDTSGEPTRTWVIEVKYNETLNVYRAGLSDTYLVKELSDDLYTSITGKTTLPYGTYSIQETKAAPGYTLNGELRDETGAVISLTTEPYVTVVDADNGFPQLQGGNEYTGYNAPVDTSIKIIKYDHNDAPLAGVTFELSNGKGEVVATKTTGADGTVHFTGLYPDKYTVTEIKTAAGETLLAEPFVVETPTRVTEEDIKTYHIDKDKLTYDPYEDIYYIFDLTYEVGNDVTFTPPMTGGVTDITTFLPLIGGMGIFGGIGTIGYRRRKKQK